MLRITVVDPSNATVKLRVEGRLTGRSVDELRRSCDLNDPDEGRRLTLDLAEVSFADAAGIALLRKLQIHNVALLNLPPFLALQLRDPEA